MPNFKSVPRERFLSNVLKTRLAYFQDDPLFEWLDITLNKPDVDKEFQLPALVIKRVVGEEFNIARNSWFYKEIVYTNTNTVERLMGYRYSTMYQFDVYATSTSESLKWVSLINFLSCDTLNFNNHCPFFL